MKYANSMADLVGNTPLVKLQKISSEANLFAKCEFMNPISIKDRPVLQIINHAEATGALKPGDTLNREIIDEILLIKEEDAFEMCRQLAAREGMLVGISSGAVAHIMAELAARTENKGKNIVGIFADSGQRYLSVEGLFHV